MSVLNATVSKLGSHVVPLTNRESGAYLFLRHNLEGETCSSVRFYSQATLVDEAVGCTGPAGFSVRYSCVPTPCGRFECALRPTSQ